MLVLATSCCWICPRAVLLHLQLRARALALEKQLNDSKKDCQQMVAALQQSMTEKVTDLRDELTSAQLQCQRMMSWGVRVMGSRHTSILLRGAWAVWKQLTWQGGDLETRERKLQHMLVRFLQSKSHRVFTTWWDLANLAKSARHQAEKVYSRLMHQHLAACFGAWRDAAAVGAHSRETVVRAGKQTRPLRAVMRRWVALVHCSRSREHVCSWMAARGRQRLIARTFRGWQQLPLIAEAASDHMRIQLQQRLLSACFDAWHSAAKGAHGPDSIERVVLAARVSKRICKGAFREWRHNAARRVRNREVVVRRYVALAWSLQSCVLVEWRSMALRRRRGRRIVARCCTQRRQQCMLAVFDAWRGSREGRRTPLDQLEHSLFRRFDSLPMRHLHLHDSFSSCADSSRMWSVSSARHGVPLSPYSTGQGFFWGVWGVFGVTSRRVDSKGGTSEAQLDFGVQVHKARASKGAAIMERLCVGLAEQQRQDDGPAGAHEQAIPGPGFCWVCRCSQI